MSTEKVRDVATEYLGYERSACARLSRKAGWSLWLGQQRLTPAEAAEVASEVRRERVRRAATGFVERQRA